MSEEDPARRRATARARLDEGEPREAFRVLEPLLAYPQPFEPESPDLELFLEIAAALEAEPLLEAVGRVRDKPREVDALYQLGYELIEHDLNRFAAAVLDRARLLAPASARVLTEQVAALERCLENAAAAEVLRAAPDLVEEDFLCRYLLAFNALLAGDLDEPRALLPGLLELDDGDYAGMSARVEGMLARGDGLAGVRPLDRDDLLGWHFVVEGGLLLHRSPEGREVMRGRYAWLQDDVARCLEGLKKLERLLAAAGLAPERVFALPDTHGATLAEAAAQAFDLPLQAWPEEGTEAPGLIVAYDLSAVGPPLRSVLEHRPGQLLFGHATCWTRDFPLAADLTTFLYQFNTSPWDPQLVVEGEEVVSRDARKIPLEERARQVLRGEPGPEALSDLPDLLALIEVARALPEPHTAGLFRAGGQRARHWAGSPVPSSRFE
ncbi:MAG: hypothetical protein AB7N76_01335 [Planctomycetota bacterium]